MSHIEICACGAKLPMFIPCLNNNCPGKMSLIDYIDGDKPKYRCSRDGCEFRDKPKIAAELTYWHKNPDKKKLRREPENEDFETAVL